MGLLPYYTVLHYYTMYIYIRASAPLLDSLLDQYTPSYSLTFVSCQHGEAGHPL